MARLFDGVNDIQSVAVAAVTVYPLTLSAWFNATASAVNGGLLVVIDGGATNFWSIRINGGAFTLRFASSQAGTSVNATGTTTFTNGTWHHACGAGRSATSRDVYLDGGGKGSNATSNTPTGLSITQMAKGATVFFNGLLAEGSVWNTDLSDAEILMLANGLHPWALKAANIKGYWPTFGTSSPEPDWSGKNNHMTVTEAVRGDHPIKIAGQWYATQRVQRVAGAAAVVTDPALLHYNVPGNQGNPWRVRNVPM